MKEKDCIAWFKKNCPYYFYKIPDSVPPMDREGSKLSRFVPKKPYDGYVLTPGFIALEFKSAPLRANKKAGSIRFDALKDHQVEGLKKVKDAGCKAYVVCFFVSKKGNKNIYDHVFIDIDDYLDYWSTSKKKSFTLSEVKDLGYNLSSSHAYGNF